MSIPKEPRQLMINIMYLVLTALLALNVSAEIFNAFKIVDKGLVKSNKALETQNSLLPASIKESAKRDKKLATYAERTDSVRAVSKEATTFFNELIVKLIDDTGDKDGVISDGDYVMKDGKRKDLKGKKNKDYATRILFTRGDGELIKQKLIDLRSDFASFADPEERDSLEGVLSIDIDDETWKAKKKKNWSELMFKQMPVQAIIPIFRKFNNDIKSSESTMMNYLANKVGLVKDVKLDQFNVTASPKKSYIIKGEPYEAEVFLTAFASESSETGISINVGGRNLPINSEGKAFYKTTPNSLGEKKYTASITVTNPVTNEKKTYKNDFSYEVGERSLAVSATQMNVFYLGVDNPIEVSAAGVASSKVKVSMGGAGAATVKKGPKGTYIVNATRPTKKGEFAKVNVSAEGFTASKNFRIKRIPDPVAKLSGKRGGSMNSGEFKAQDGVFAILENFDFNAKCNVSGYRVVRVARRKDPQVAVNAGGRFSADSKRVIAMAAPGDSFYFENIKCKCPGDVGPRDLGSMSFKINSSLELTMISS